MTRLLLVTLLLAAIALVVRTKARGSTATRPIKVTGRTAVNRGAVVAVVEVEGRRLLVGAAANQVTVLAELGAATAMEHAVEPVAATPVPARPLGHPASGSFVQRARRMTVRTVDPSVRPSFSVHRAGARSRP